MNKQPLISVIAPAYNSEQYICDLIDSFLAQSYKNFELVIVDDCSLDRTVEKVESYKDARIKLVKHNWNKGVNEALNTAFDNVSGEYVAFAAGDDLVKPTYLEHAVEELQKNTNIGVLYTSLIVTDEFGKVMKSQPKWAMQKKGSRASLLNKMFYEENAILSPGMIVKKQCLDDFRPIDISLSIYQDYFLHVNLLIRTEIAFSPEAEYYYRRSAGSISARKDDYWRKQLETPRLMDVFLKINDLNFLSEVLQNNNLDIKYKELIPYYIGMSALRSPKSERQKWGYRTILEFISDAARYEKLHELTGFSYKNLLDLSLESWHSCKRKSRRKRKIVWMVVLVMIFLLAFVWKIVVL